MGNGTVMLKRSVVCFSLASPEPPGATTGVPCCAVLVGAEQLAEGGSINIVLRSTGPRFRHLPQNTKRDVTQALLIG